MKEVQPLRTKRDIEAVKYALRKKSKRDYALFMLGVCTGRRISDLLGLAVGDMVSGKGKRLQIVKRLRLKEGKTGKMIDVVLSESAKSALREYLKTRKPLRMEDPLFPSRNKSREGGKRPVSRRQICRVIKGAAVACGIESNTGTHTMRKTFGYLMHKEGKHIADIMKLLNHASEETTLAYIGITQERLDECVLSIDV